MKTYKFNNPNASATIKQRIYLHFLTGKDTKGMKITVKQAADMIDKARKNQGKTSGKSITVTINGKSHKAILVN